MQTIGLDYFGKPHYSNLWVGDGGFQYWTDVRKDSFQNFNKLKVNTGDDVAFVDGGLVLWTFAPFNVVKQDPSLFQYPTPQCSKQCSTSFSFTEIADPLIKLTLASQK